MKYSLGIVLLVFVAFSCSDDPWTSEEKSDFLNSCEEEGGSPGYCDCFMKNTMEVYPRYEDAHGMSFEEAVELSENCQ
ncbi:MAG: hypothetical protein HUJ25_04010 [Crocinitomicaceae bacterium]|nr:hypothetical protein [Crocinitomicaceae bacterium]